MSKFNEYVVAFFVSGFTMLYGNDSTITKLVYGFMIFLTFDLITGCAKSLKKKDLQSRKLELGIMKKIGMLLCISLCYFIDYYQIINVGISLESASVSFFIVGEVVSIIENLIEMGVKVPKQLSDFLKVQVDKEGENIAN
jgi:toxin secretion/phage lysis holin